MCSIRRPGERKTPCPVGRDAGCLLEDFSLVCYDGTEFRLADTRGRVTFINLWATYCTPCKNELPFFQALYEAHPDDIAVIAVHPSLVLDDPEAYLAGRGFTIPFATDTDDNVDRIVGGTGTLPQTVVLNRRGEVVYNRVGSVTLEMLEALFAEAAE